MEDFKFWQSPTGLYLPTSMLPKRYGSGSMHPGAVMLDAESALGLPCTYRGVADLVRSYTFEQVLAFVARVGAMTHHTAIQESSTLQDGLLARVFSGPEFVKVAKARRALATRVGVAIAFCDRQMLGLLKVAALECGNVRGPGAEGLRELAVAALMVNGFIDGDAMGDSRAEADKEVYLFANLLFEHHPNLVHAIGRAHEMFNEPNPRKTEQRRALGTRLNTLVGVDPDDLLAMFFGLSTPFYSLGEKEIDQGQVAVDLGFWSRGTDLTRERVESFAGLLAIDIDELRQQLRQRSGSAPGWFDAEVLRRRPLVRVGDNLLCPFPRWLDWAISGGIEFRLLEDRAGSAEYLSLRGDVLECGLRRAFARTFPGRVIHEPELQGAIGSQKVCEMVVDYGDALVLVECKAGTVGAGARAGESTAAYNSYVQRTYKDPIAKFASLHHALQQGLLEKFGIYDHGIRAIYPVIVNYEVPIPFLTALRLEREARTNPLWSDPRIRVPQYLTIEEAELLEAWLPQLGALAKVLESKVQEDSSCAATFTNFVASKAPSLVGEHSPYYSDLYHRLGDQFLERWRQWGLPGASP